MTRLQKTLSEKKAPSHSDIAERAALEAEPDLENLFAQIVAHCSGVEPESFANSLE